MKTLVGLLALVIPCAAWGQDCTPYDAVAKQLETEFGEHRAASGLSGQGWLMEVWRNADTGTWSIVLKAPNGCGAIADAGQGFEVLSMQKGRAL